MMDPKKKTVSMSNKPRATLGRATESKKPKPVCDRKTTVTIAESRKMIGAGAIKKPNASSKEPTAGIHLQQVNPLVDLPCPELSSTQDLSSISDTPTEDSLKAISSSSSNVSLSQPVKPRCIRPYPTVAALKKNDPKATKLDQQLNELAEKTLQKNNIQKGLAKRPVAPPIAAQSKRVVQPVQPKSTRPATLVKEPSTSIAPIARPPTRRVVKPSPSSPPAPVVRTVSNNSVIPSPAKRSTSNGTSTSGVGKKKDIGSGTKNVPVDGEPSTPRKGDESFAVKVFHKKQSKSPISEPVKPCKLCGLKTESRTNDDDGGDKNKENELELEHAQNRIVDLEIQVKHLEEQLSVRNEDDSIVKDEAGLLQANLEYAMNRIAELEKENEVLVQQMKNQEDVFQREMDATVQDCAKAVKSVDSFWDESKRECDELKKKNSELEMKNSELQIQLEVILQPKPISTPSQPQTPTDCTGETLRDFTNTVNESSLQVPVRVPVETTAEHEDLNAAQSENRPVPSAQLIERSHATRSIETDKENRLDRESNASKKITGTIKENQKLAMLRKASGGSIRNGLLAWCQGCVEGYRNVSVTNFSTSFADGLALCALIHSLAPSLIDMNELSPSTPMKNYETAVAAASMMGVGVELDIKAIVCSENPPWETILSYIVEIYNVHTSE